MQSVSDKRKFKYLFWYNFNTLDLFHKTLVFFFQEDIVLLTL